MNSSQTWWKWCIP